MKLRDKCLVSGATVAFIIGSASVHAQEAKPSKDNGDVTDVVITSTKRKERLQSVPVSVTVVTSDIIERNNVRELGDLVKLSPALSINYGSQPGNFSINMRGIGTFSNGVAVESDVAVVIDDVPVGFQAAAFKDLVDIERVEVLRGPQSTIFGKSAIAGVLNIATQAPTATLTGKATGLVTDDGEWRAGFTVAGPLSDHLGFRLTAAHNDYRGNIRNLTTGDWLNGSTGDTITGKLQWTPRPDWQFTLAPRWNRTDAQCCVSAQTSLTPGLFYQGITQLPEAQVLSGITINPTNRTVRNDYRAGGISQTQGATIRVNHDLSDDSPLGAASVMSITSFDHYKLRDFQDIDGTDSHFLLYYPTTAPTGLDQGAVIDGNFHVNSFSQEFRLTSPSTGPFKYVAGLWYARNDLARYLKRGPVLSLAEYLAQSTNENYAAFAQATYDLTPKTTVIGGLRINREDIEYHFSQRKVLPWQEFGRSDTDTAVTGRLGIQHRWSDNVMGFLTYSTGYKGQAYDLVSTFSAKVAAEMPVPAETAKNIELGIKTSSFNRRLVFNATVFDTDFRGFQTSVTSTLPDGTFLTFLNSVGRLRTKGVEIDSIARITHNLRLTASAAYTDATVAQFPNGPCYSGQTLAQGCYVDATNSRVQNLAGKPLNNIARWKFTLGGQQDIPLSSVPFDAFVSFAYRWQDKINFALSQDPITVQKAYGVLDGGIGISDHKSRYKLTLYVNNLLDKHYAVGIGNTTSGFSAPGVTAAGTTWQPARDSFRYVSLRLDSSF